MNQGDQRRVVPSGDTGSVSDRTVKHRIQVPGGAVTATRERIERVLGVITSTRPEGHVWAIYFDAPADVSLDFLRPDVLPPRGVPS